jgi:hypothetical protein
MTLIVFGSQFKLGQIVITRHALNELSRDEVRLGLRRHMNGDWGELNSFDREQNDLALIEGGRLMSRYEAEGGMVFWIITEHDRSATTILLPSDY